MSALKKIIITASLMFLTTALFADEQKVQPKESAKAPVVSKTSAVTKDAEKVKSEKTEKVASKKAPKANKKSKKAPRKQKCPKSTRSRLRRRAC